MPLIGVVVFTWIARAIWISPLWDVVEDIALGLFALGVALQIVQDAKKSNLEKKACSKLIEQISFITQPNLTHTHPFRKAELFGWLTGGAALYLIVYALLKIKN